MFTANYLYNYTEQSTFSLIANDSSDTENKNPNVNDKRRGWNMITATQMIIFLLFVFGIFFAILIYCKTCTRGSSARYSEHNAYPSERSTSVDSRPYSYSIYESADRPPPYNEACNAPPLYESPFNTVSMLEAPPVYPETPKASERVSHSINQTFPITNHI
ncbi:PREDICTED: uncharacterized protein LOC108577285 isoform X2 [Habropoda laboriosa]|uniref:uncharacterized protein LOC108577285 isoform X2 n=1 Tax=Habropoda laboriosa TaxID=597456 RepID=UPI00083D766A|nr:PREDICTED: uncharacterized protein LOC108577285 isoform X2 [Habropoda laboriosa]